MLRLYVVRHAERTYPADGLTERGAAQAEALARRLVELGVERLYTSPLERARRTVAPAAGRLGIEAEVAPWLAEREEWLIREEGEEELPVWGLDPALVHDGAPPVDRDNWHRLEPLSDPAIRHGLEVVARGSDGLLAALGHRRRTGLYEPSAGAPRRVAACTHLGVGLAWIGHLLAIAPPLVWAGFTLPQGSITRIDFVPAPGGAVAPRCRYLGRDDHLDGV